MLAATIISLREMLEICLIISMVLAALSDIKYRKKVLLIGGSIGVLFSVFLALALNIITNLFDGNGQEILNIIILAASLICIALTILWVNKHGQHLYKNISAAGKKFESEEENNIWPMVTIIALALGREGAELILFLNGVYAVGTGVIDIFLGVMIGFAISIFIAYLLYIGLFKVPTRYFFRVINVMLILLAANMASQLANYLMAADIISSFSTDLWNTSWLISDESVLGKIIYSILGYSSRPTQLQIIFYSFTIVIMFSLLKKSKLKTELSSK
jgi:high-affinity iron transporter